jgi:hypothetical protein
MLQGRGASREELARPPPPRDATLGAAVARMSHWATEHGHDALVMTAADWETLVVKHLGDLSPTDCYQDLLTRAAGTLDESELGDVTQLASNIWNNTPQPDRGGRTANQLAGLPQTE